MSPRSPFRRLLALLLTVGVMASSSGFAVHDPDCPHHRAPDADHHPPGLAQEGEGHGHHGGAPRPGPAPSDCECLGFCAVAGMSDPALPALAPAGAFGSPAPALVLRGAATPPACAACAALQPPATGPPVVA